MTALALFAGFGGTLALTGAASADPSTLFAASTVQGAGDCFTAATACTLDTALTTAAVGDTIDLVTAGSAGSYSGNFVVTTAGALTIEPAAGVTNPTLDGATSGSVLTVMGTTLNLSGVTIQNGQAANGGGINNEAGALTISNVTFSSNTSTATSGSGGGGAIDNADNGSTATVTVADSTFTGNTASNNGGAIDNGDNGGTGTLTVTDSTFTGNTASNNGGAIDSADDAGTGTFTVAGSTFSGNQANDGAAIDNADGLGQTTAPATVTDSTFSANTATADGGAIDNGDHQGTGDLTVSGSTLTGNGGGDGGAIDNGDNSGTGVGSGTLTVTTSTLAANTASADGGAIDNADHQSAGTVALTASTLTANTAVSGSTIDNGDNPGGFTGSRSVTVAADVIAGTCGQVGSSTWTDNGDNATTDASCANAGTADVTATDLASLLGPLADNGGTTQTSLLLAGNPAIGLVPNPTTGLCPVAADQRGVASVTGSACDAGAVQLQAQTITFTSTAPTDAVTGGSPYTPTAMATSGLAVTFTIDASSTAGTCSVASGVVSFTGMGSCVIDADQAGNSNFPAAPQVQQTVAVGTGSQAITFTTTGPVGAVANGPSYTPTATGGGSGEPVVFSVDPSSTAGACSVSSGVVSFTGIGSCVVDANQAGNGNWTAAPQVVQAIGVGPANTSAGSHLAATPDGTGYWVVSPTGVLSAFGTAVNDGSTAGLTLNAPIVGIASTPDGHGYWEVASDGGVFSYGDAAFYGSTGAIHLNQPVVGIASTPDGHGYWEVASDGGVFSYGDAAFYGSTGAIHLNQPIVGVSAAPDGQGYWLAASDGGVFAFGDTGFFGSMGGTPLNKNIVGITHTADGLGYWLVASDGGVFTFGDAAFHGSLGGAASASATIGLFTTAGGYSLVDNTGTATPFS